jgi:hypothetical protein
MNHSNKKHEFCERSDLLTSFSGYTELQKKILHTFFVNLPGKMPTEALRTVPWFLEPMMLPLLRGALDEDAEVSRTSGFGFKYGRSCKRKALLSILSF